MSNKKISELTELETSEVIDELVIVDKLTDETKKQTKENLLKEVQSDIDDHVADLVNPHEVTKTQVGLGNVTNVEQIPLSQKGANNGVAELDADGKVPASQLTVEAMEYKGSWNPSTNTPTLADGIGGTGDVYVASVDGSVDLGSGTIDFQAGDWVIYDGSVWERSRNSNKVVSVNGQMGIVVLNAGHISFTPAGGIIAENLQSAIEELDNEKISGITVDSTLKGIGTVGDPIGINQIRIQPIVYDATSELEVGDMANDFTWIVPQEFNGWKILTAHAMNNTAGVDTSTGKTEIQVHNTTQAVDVCSTIITIDSGESTSYTAEDQPVINQSNNTLSTGDVIRFDIDAITDDITPIGLQPILIIQAP